MLEELEPVITLLQSEINQDIYLHQSKTIGEFEPGINGVLGIKNLNIGVSVTSKYFSNGVQGFDFKKKLLEEVTK